jgi:alkylation response protein AidB-like acyl-CoA dehydrogenase
MWHDVGLPDETVELRADVRRAVENAVVPHATEIGQREETADSFPWQAFRGLADEGVFAIPFGPEFGRGFRYPLLGTCTATEEIAYHSSSVAGVYDGQCILAPKALSFGSEELQARLVPGLISGELVLAFATTEPDASSDLSVEAMQTVAAETDDGFVVTGRKRWITNSPVADWVAVLCRSGRGMTMLAVDLKNSPGVRIGTPDLKMGHRGQLTADIVFDNVIVPRANVLGEPGHGLSVALATLTFGRIGIAAAGVGVTQAALDLAVERMRTRHVFGKPLGAMQHWQYRLAERASSSARETCIRRRRCGSTAVIVMPSPRRRWPSPSPPAWLATWPATRSRSTARTGSPVRCRRRGRRSDPKSCTGTPRSSRSSRAQTKCCSG